MEQNTLGEIFLSCPFTRKGLRLMSKAELTTVNEKVTAGELLFYPGVPVEVKLKKAFVTEHSTYIYPVFEDIICLKKETAIVPKNRTQNPLLRVSEKVVDTFYTFYRLRRKDKSKDAQAYVPSAKVSNEKLGTLKKLLPREGGVLVSSCNDSIDAVHNLIFSLQYQQVVHFDHSFERLKLLKAELKKDAMLVLGDVDKLPFSDASLSAVFSFDDVAQYEKADQKLIYDELKRSLSPEGSSVMLFNKNKKLHAEANVKSDKMMSKARSILKPWKKEKVAEIHFHGIEVEHDHADFDQSFISKTSLGRQMM